MNERLAVTVSEGLKVKLAVRLSGREKRRLAVPNSGRREDSWLYL